MTKRIYEIDHVLFNLGGSEELCRAIRKKAYLTGVENPTEKQIEESKQEQVKFAKAIRECMVEGEVLEDYKEYINKRMSIIPGTENDMSFLIVFYDIDTDNTTVLSAIGYDAEKDLFYIEIEEEE